MEKAVEKIFNLDENCRLKKDWRQHPSLNNDLTAPLIGGGGALFTGECDIMIEGGGGLMAMRVLSTDVGLCFEFFLKKTFLMGNPIERYLSEALAASPASNTIGGQEREVRSLGKFIFVTHFIFPFLYIYT